MSQRLTGFQCDFVRCVRDGIPTGVYPAVEMHLFGLGIVRNARGASERGWQLTPRGVQVALLLGTVPPSASGTYVECDACKGRRKHPKDRYWPGRDPRVMAWGSGGHRCVNCELTRRDVSKAEEVENAAV